MTKLTCNSIPNIVPGDEVGNSPLNRTTPGNFLEKPLIATKTLLPYSNRFPKSSSFLSKHIWYLDVSEEMAESKSASCTVSFITSSIPHSTCVSRSIPKRAIFVGSLVCLFPVSASSNISPLSDCVGVSVGLRRFANDIVWLLQSCKRIYLFLSIPLSSSFVILTSTASLSCYLRKIRSVYSAANDPQPQMIPTRNDPQVEPQMIPNGKWSPMWTANDPRRKITNGTDFGFLDFFLSLFYFDQLKDKFDQIRKDILAT